MTPDVAMHERRVDLRLVQRRPLVEGWSQALGLDTSRLPADVLARQVGGVDNPLLPDILGVARALATELAAERVARLVLVDAEGLGWDDRRVEAWLRRDVLRRGGQAFDAGPGPASSPPDPVNDHQTGEVRSLALEGRVLAALRASPPSADLVRSGAVEDLLVLASACMSLDHLDTARQIAHAAERVTSDPALVRRAVRRQVLATRSLGLLEELPTLRARLMALPRPVEELAAAWLDFDLAVASSFDPLRLGYRELLERAGRIADRCGDRLLASACHLWLATYYFFAGDFGESVARQRHALDVLDDVGAIRRSLPLRLRIGSTLTVLGRWDEAAEVLEEGATLAALAGLPATADALVLALCRADPGRCPSTRFTSVAADQLETIRALITWAGVPPGSAVQDARIRVTRPDLVVQLELVLLDHAVRFNRAEDRDRASARLAEALEHLPEEFRVLAAAHARSFLAGAHR